MFAISKSKIYVACLEWADCLGYKGLYDFDSHDIEISLETSKDPDIVELWGKMTADSVTKKDYYNFLQEIQTFIAETYEKRIR
jgi:hypothetical protein